MAKILFIRHGQASLGMADYDALSDTGIQQSKTLGVSLLQRGIKIDKIFSGTMQRHLQTATHCLKAMQCTLPFEQDASWNEFDHTDIIAKYEPRYSDMQEIINDVSSAENPKQKIMELLAAAMQRWVAGEDDDYIESWEAFNDRIETGLKRLSERLDKKETALVFTSGGPVCTVMKKVFSLTPEKMFELQLNLANASISQFKNSSRGLQLISFNDHAHFQGEHAGLFTWR